MVSKKKNKKRFKVMEMTNIANGGNYAKKSKTFVICEDSPEHPHPHCPHGPMLLFVIVCSNTNENRDYETQKKYFACAAYRNSKKCKYQLSVPVSEEDLQRRFIPGFDWKGRNKILEYKRNNNNICYCLTCDKISLNDEIRKHLYMSCMNKILTKEDFKDPTKFLRSQCDDQAQAQYFFDDKALELFMKWFEKLHINKIVCIGAPRLHAYIIQRVEGNPNLKMQSFLLDLDSRFNYFYEDNQFGWYNMCNNHFFNNNQKAEFEKFLKCTENELLLFFTDPPYGCRTEPIALTLHQLTLSFNKINERVYQPVPIFWIFPYFSEHYIKERMPQMEMLDYKINYTNHDIYTDVGLRKYGSPARLFTNVPLVKLPIKDNNEYKYCGICCRYTAKENLHCKECGVCTSKNGTTYHHCKYCDKCVKPSYLHCAECRRCAQQEGHNCEEYQRYQSCRICLQLGHVEQFCCFIKKPENEKSAYINCYLCGGNKHNERTCPQRNRLLIEDKFMGVPTVRRIEVNDENEE